MEAQSPKRAKIEPAPALSPSRGKETVNDLVLKFGSDPTKAFEHNRSRKLVMKKSMLLTDSIGKYILPPGVTGTSSITEWINKAIIYGAVQNASDPNNASNESNFSNYFKPVTYAINEPTLNSLLRYFTYKGQLRQVKLGRLNSQTCDIWAWNSFNQNTYNLKIIINIIMNYFKQCIHCKLKPINFSLWYDTEDGKLIFDPGDCWDSLNAGLTNEDKAQQFTQLCLTDELLPRICPDTSEIIWKLLGAQVFAAPFADVLMQTTQSGAIAKSIFSVASQEMEIYRDNVEPAGLGAVLKTIISKLLKNTDNNIIEKGREQLEAWNKETKKNKDIKDADKGFNCGINLHYSDGTTVGLGYNWGYITLWCWDNSEPFYPNFHQKYSMQTLQGRQALLVGHVSIALKNSPLILYSQGPETSVAILEAMFAIIAKECGKNLFYRIVGNGTASEKF
jgi:hypothetical protein